jgi:hypothetical protein
VQEGVGESPARFRGYKLPHSENTREGGIDNLKGREGGRKERKEKKSAGWVKASMHLRIHGFSLRNESEARIGEEDQVDYPPAFLFPLILSISRLALQLGSRPNKYDPPNMFNLDLGFGSENKRWSYVFKSQM